MNLFYEMPPWYENGEDWRGALVIKSKRWHRPIQMRVSYADGTRWVNIPWDSGQIWMFESDHYRIKPKKESQT